MKKIILFASVMVLSISVNAQLLLINDEILGSTDLLKTIPIECIQEISVDKKENITTGVNLFDRNNSIDHLTIAKIQNNFEFKTQEELNQFFGLNSGNDLYANGFLIEDRNYKISSKSIRKIEIIEIDNGLVLKRILNITMY